MGVGTRLQTKAVYLQTLPSSPQALVCPVRVTSRPCGHQSPAEVRWRVQSIPISCSRTAPIPCTFTGAELFALRAAQICIGVDDRSHFIASSESKAALAMLSQGAAVAQTTTISQ